MGCLVRELPHFELFRPQLVTVFAMEPTVENTNAFAQFGELQTGDVATLRDLISGLDGLAVGRFGKARSVSPFPTSTDLEAAFKGVFCGYGFVHHHALVRPGTGDRFEWDFGGPHTAAVMRQRELHPCRGR